MRTVELSKFSDYNSISQKIICGKVYPMSVTQGFQQGRIYELEDCVLIWHYSGFCFVSGTPSETDCESIFELMNNAKSDAKRLVLFCESKSLAEAFVRCDVCVENRSFYEFAQKRPNDIILPGGFEIRELDERLLSRLDGHITPSFSWESSKRFLENGKGFCAVCGDTPAAWAFSAAVSDTEIDIGVETLELFRGKGLAAAVAGKMAEYVLCAGKKPVWACHADNTASHRTALKVGFKKVNECFIVRLACR